MPAAAETLTDGKPAPCDLMVVDGYVLTLDDQRRVVPDGAVAIRSGRIVEVGPTATLRARYAPA